ncbi:hypothetical protein [Roseomonas sp. USHLN139]|uniref:hypothetical protein n=1 Tax=Roseomonas sp. USHLN139 TaxID=3081298 RepID=UPI003B01987B
MFSAASTINRLTPMLTDVQRNQVPFATAKALTSVAQLGANAIRRDLPSIFDRPTPFTMRGPAFQPATKSSLTARVFIRATQAEYLTLQETGGTRQPKKTAIVMPRAIRRNQYGNMAARALQQLKASKRKDIFVGKAPSGQGGFYLKLPDDKLRPLVTFISQARYKPRFQFRARVAKVVKASMGPAFAEELARAIATARR